MAFLTTLTLSMSWRDGSKYNQTSKQSSRQRSSLASRKRVVFCIYKVQGAMYGQARSLEALTHRLTFCPQGDTKIQL